MAKAETYTVLREHEGDRYYRAGDARELDPASAAHLVRLGVLTPAAPEPEKTEPPVKTKVDPPAKEKAAADQVD